MLKNFEILYKQIDNSFTVLLNSLFSNDNYSISKFLTTTVQEI